jgi:DNA-binding transcriptional ArsR family regulator
MASICDFDCTAKTLKAIAHPLRLKILCNLNRQELTVADIVSLAGSSQSNISQHLIMLRELGILAARRDANRVYYRVDNTELLGVIGMMRELYCGDEAG